MSDHIIPARDALVVAECACGNRIEVAWADEGMLDKAWLMKMACGCGVTWTVRGHGISVTDVKSEGESRPR